VEDQYWKRYKPEELEEKIKNNPVTEKGLQMLTSNNHIQVSFVIFENPQSKGVVMYCGCTNGIPKYHIVLNKLSLPKECIETFAHELIHVYYNCGGTYLNAGHKQAIEELIEKEAIAAATTYSFVIESILRAYLKL